MSTRLDSSYGFKAMATRNYIPEDLIINILSNLPVKSLLRFRTVCKSWLSLISNPIFVDLQLLRADESLLVHYNIGCNYHSIALHSSMEHPYFEWEIYWKHKLIILGSYNGIVCALVDDNSSVYDIHTTRYFFSGHFDSVFHIYLCNPVTRQSKLLPLLPSDEKKCIVSVGFGFDPMANDLKVVKIAAWPSEKRRKMLVYSANMNVWKEIKPCLTIDPLYSVSDVCLKGVLYWSSLNGVIRFDLNNEVVYYDTFPANVRGTNNCIYGRNERITEMNDSIAVIMYQSSTLGFPATIHVWTVDDGFGVSWNLKCRFDVDSTVAWVHGYLNNSVDFVFKDDDGKWLFYNSENKETKSFPVPFAANKMFRHTESLVLIRGSEHLDEMLKKFKMKDQDKQISMLDDDDDDDGF